MTLPAHYLSTPVETLAPEPVPVPLIERVLAREIDPANPPAPSEPRYYVAGRITGTAGNLGQISSKAKTGKTAVIGAHIAATVKAEGLGDQEADTLGITAAPPKGRAVVVIDTEQAPEDACALITRSLRRLGLGPKARPPWLRGFSLAGFGARDLSQALPQLLDRLAAEHSGIHSVLIDGGADFAVNVNDPEEAGALIAGWHALAIKHAFHLLTVIHSNEGAADDIARGWLGKQLRRKAESNLQLRKDGEVITLFSDTGQRRAPIPQAEGPTFTWDVERGMHVSTKPIGSARLEAEVADLRELAAEVFDQGQVKGWTELQEAIMKARGISKNTADKRIKRMKVLGVIRHAGRAQWMNAL